MFVGSDVGSFVGSVIGSDVGSLVGSIVGDDDDVVVVVCGGGGISPFDPSPHAIQSILINVGSDVGSVVGSAVILKIITIHLFAFVIPQGSNANNLSVVSCMDDEW